jgi:hypothetical protein
MKTLPALVTIPLLVLGLSGCTLLGGGGGGGGASEGSSGAGSTGGEELAGGSTACIMDRNWSLDIDDSAAKLEAYMLENGLTVVETTAVGEQLIWFDEIGTAGSATDLTYTMIADMGDGLTMTMTQRHEGSPFGQWAWDGSADSTIVFNEWSDDYLITTDTSINGTSAPTSTTPMSGGLSGQTMTVSCDGDTLTTQAEGSPFTQVWHPEG